MKYILTMHDFMVAKLIISTTTLNPWGWSRYIKFCGMHEYHIQSCICNLEGKS